MMSSKRKFQLDQGKMSQKLKKNALARPSWHFAMTLGKITSCPHQDCTQISNTSHETKQYLVIGSGYTKLENDGLKP